MKRTYKKRPLALDTRLLGKIGLTLFMLFIAYKIITPPSDVTAIVQSPDGSKTARIRTVYYYDEHPSYKVDYRAAGSKMWQGIYFLPANTNTAWVGDQVSIEWAGNSDLLHVFINTTNIWTHSFL